MKDTSIKKLNFIYTSLKGSEYDTLADLITELIRAESTTKVKGSKFDIFDYVSNDVRPIMCGVFHDEGWRVASDAHILVALKEGYPEEYEHKVLKRDGSLEEGRYPQWSTIIPKDDGYEAYKFDTQKFYDWLSEKRAQYKAETGRGTKWQGKWRVQVGPATLKAELFDKLVTAMKRLGTDKLYIKDANRSVYAKTDDGVVLLMPILADDDPTDTLTLA